MGLTNPTIGERLVCDRVRSALACLEHLTSDEFSKGGDRPARDALAAILWIMGGADAGDPVLADYGEAVDQANLDLHGFVR